MLFRQTAKERHEVIPYIATDSVDRNAKYFRAKEILEEFLVKFSQVVDGAIFKELDRIIINSDSIFINQRSASHFAKLAYSIYFVRRKFARNKTLFPFRDYFDVRVFSSLLHFTFGSKSVLSILTHAHLRDKYEIFDEEQILFIIRKYMPDIQIVKDSVYIFHPSKGSVKTLYFEIHKKNGLSFTNEEVIQIKRLLKKEIKFSIEQLVPRVFMIRNEEEVLKNILTLSREIRFFSDLPQVMILFDEQTSQEVLFTVILVKLLKSGQPTVHECFSKMHAYVEYLPERSQIVRYLRNKHPLEANVFRIKLEKDPSLLRIDMSLNFYLARQKISQVLMEAIGDFRDYNGGIIIKQREALASFREAFRVLSLKEPDLLENFYYSLSPIEAQATLSLESLRIFFELFLEAREFNFNKPSDSFLKFESRNKQLFIAIHTPDETLKAVIDPIVSPGKLSRKVVTLALPVQNTYFLGYLITEIDGKAQHYLSQLVTQALKHWKIKVESRQSLKLTLASAVVSLDPRIGGDQTSALVLKMLFEGLMRINRLGKLESGVCERVTISRDQKTYVFQLRPTLWSDGSQVLAYDFEYAWKKVLTPTFKTPFAYLFYPIKNAKAAKEGLLPAHAVGIKVLGDLTLQVELEFPSPYFLELIAHPIYSPVNRIIDQRHPNWSFEDKQGYVCNGAFQLKRNNIYGEYELTKNPLYWDAMNIKLDEVRLSKASRYQAYEMFQKDMDHWIGSPLGTWDPSFSLAKNDEQVVFSNKSVYWVVFNTQRFPFNHKKVRQALAGSIDPLKIRACLDEEPVFSPLPSKHSQVENSAFYTLEQAQALFKEVLIELGLSLVDFPQISLIYLAGGAHQRAQFIKESWENNLGIRCRLEPLEWKLLFARMTEGDFQTGGINWEPWVDDPIYTLNAFRRNNELINFPKWENDEYHEIMQRAEREIEGPTRYAYYLQAEKILLEEMPVLPFCLVQPLAMKKKNLIIHGSSTLMNFKWGYFES